MWKRIARHGSSIMERILGKEKVQNMLRFIQFRNTLAMDCFWLIVKQLSSTLKDIIYLEFAEYNLNATYAVSFYLFNRLWLLFFLFPFRKFLEIKI